MLTPTVRSPKEDPLNLISRVLTKLHSIWISLFYPFASKGANLSIHYTCQLSRKLSRRIKLGSSIIIQKNTWLNVAASDACGEPTIIIDDNCCVSTDAIISAKNRIHLEPYVMLGQATLVQDHNHAYEDISTPIAEQGITEGGTIRIGYGTFIGKGVSIICSSGNLTIGRHSVIGANSVVLRSIPAYSVAFGNPAKVVKHFDPVKRAWVLGARNPVPTDLEDQLACSTPPNLAPI